MSNEELNIFKYANQLQKLPARYNQLEGEKISRKIKQIGSKLGDNLVLLGHNYQSAKVLSFCEHSGDSYKLAKIASSMKEATYIIFCGVTFMAESADILTSDNQQVIVPALEAACPMAGMAELVQVEGAWRELGEFFDLANVTPITYMNSYADLKAFCGRNNGAVCTSSNATKLFEWALAEGERIFFFPDEHLGRNTARELGMGEDEIAVWNPWAENRGGLSEEELSSARIILWAGNCQVHQRFKPEDVRKIKNQVPEVTVMVHPECRRAVVKKADRAGSTGQIIEAVENAPPGSNWAIGTETNLISHLEEKHPDKQIYHLGEPARNTCYAMAQITPAHLLWMLESIEAGEAKNVISVDSKISEQALKALDKMIKITEGT